MFDEYEKIKRPMNSFMVWAQMKRPFFVKKYPRYENKDISNLLGKIWKNLPDHEKDDSRKKAWKLAELHKQQYPNWKYNPRKRNSPKNVVPKNVLPRAVKRLTLKSRGRPPNKNKKCESKRVQVDLHYNDPIFTDDTDSDYDYLDTIPNTPQRSLIKIYEDREEMQVQAQDAAAQDAKAQDAELFDDISYLLDTDTPFNFNTDFVECL